MQNRTGETIILTIRKNSDFDRRFVYFIFYLFPLMTKTQHYANHKRIDPLFHGVIFISAVIGALLLLVGFIALLIVNSQDLANLPWFMVCIFAGVILIAI